ncbi:MAG TPA: response regulator [Candidatus Limnocylindria bacterium]|nr:response regulator [Candidatus Limnocylindria bacterium]
MPTLEQGNISPDGLPSDTASGNEFNRSASATPIQRSPLLGIVRLLVVEDHADTSRSLVGSLTRHGYIVTIAKDATTALALAARHRFDLLVSDIGLPDMNGTELMRQLGALYGMPGVAVSGYGMEDDIRLSYEAGFSEHLVKPISTSHLIDAIGRVLRKR